MPSTSRYVILVDNISSATSREDLRYEFRYAGPIRDIVKDTKHRCALIEYERSADADYAYRKLHGIMLNGRELKVEYANRSDFKFFGWSWFEHSPSPAPKRQHSASRSRSRSKSASRSRSRSHSKSPPETPHNKDGQRQAASTSPNDESS